MGASSKRRVSEILSHYPNPVVVQQARWLRTLRLASCGVPVVVGTASYLDGSTFGLCVVAAGLIWLWTLVGGSGGMTLDAEGFAIDGRRANGRWAWSDVENFRAEIKGEHSDAWFDLRACAADQERTVRVRNTFGLSHGALVSLMRQWQQLADTARPTVE